MTPSSSGPTPLNPRGRGGGSEPGEGESRPAEPRERSESAISNEATAVRTLASAHRLAGEIENEARRKADEITAQAELWANEHEQEARAKFEAMIAEANAERDRIWEQIRSGVGKATRQVGDLIRIREELRLDLHEAMRDSSTALYRLEDEGDEDAAPPAAPAWLPGDAPELPAAEPEPAPSPAPDEPIAGTASEVAAEPEADPEPAAEAEPEPAPEPRRGSPLSPSGGRAAAPDEPKAPPPGAAAPATEPQATPKGADTLSSLRAGPFESFLAVMRFERELAVLDPIDAVYVRRFAGGEVDVEVESHGGPPALAEALGAMPGVQAVQDAGGVLRVRMGPEPPSTE